MGGDWSGREVHHEYNKGSISAANVNFQFSDLLWFEWIRFNIPPGVEKIT